MAEGSSHDRSVVHSVGKAIAILDQLALARRPRSVAELAGELGQDRAVVHRLLRTLRRAEMVEEPEPGRYGLGPRALYYGSAYVDRLAITRAALPYIIDLKATVFADRPWLVTLALPTGPEATLVERIWAPGLPLAQLVEIGMRLPIAESAMGRVMLAYMSVERVVAAIGPDRAAELAPRFEEIRSGDGIEIATNELRPGITAIAAAVLRRSGDPIAAVAVSGTDLEPFGRGSDVAQDLRQTARRIASALD